jgi:hypothetical protein
MIEAKDEGEEVVLHPYVPSTPSEELARSRRCALPSPPHELQLASGKDLRVRRNVLS